MAALLKARVTQRQFLKWCGLAMAGAGAAGGTQLVSPPRAAFATQTFYDNVDVYAANNGGGVSAIGSLSPVKSPGFKLYDGATMRGALGLAEGNGAWSSSAATGDLVLRADTGKLHLLTGVGTAALTIASGNVGIGTTGPTERLQVTGNARIDGSLLLSSGGVWQPIYGADNGLAGDWSFSDIAGSTAYDRGPYGNDGTINGATRADGKYGPNTALQFNSTSYVAVANHAALNSSSFSFELWIKAGSLNGGWAQGSNQILFRGSYLSSGFRCGILSDYRLSFWTSQSGGNGGVESTVPIGTDRFYHVVFTYDGTTGTWSIDGKSAGSAGFTYVPPAGTLYINGPAGGEALSGSNSLITQVKWYGRVLLPEEVSAHYLRGRTAGLVISDRFRILNSTASELLRVTSGGTLCIGTTDPGTDKKLRVAGNAQVDGDLVVSGTVNANMTAVYAP